MKIWSAIQLKASLLTLVFLSNMMVSLACAVGTDMRLNRAHHHDKTAYSHKHTHNNSKPHDHASHNHDKSSSDQQSSKSSKDNCCKDEVVKLTKADKLNQPGFDYSLLSQSFFILPYTAYNVGYLRIISANVSNEYLAWQHYHPPIPDLRIAIQSFQI
ncbi:HYC_CC_PP family protein [Pedobacter helvus]|uniref:HYC_CC_PP family protein n=1 Tax=Pedobacter helvus TaxID=2563444 RepID=A0ABW9JNQ8_9SPHI|nr:hypothetical protein [Pedobacter ureilyticus]